MSRASINQNFKLQARQGFTLLELLVVIGVILVLIGFLFVAGQRLIASNRVTATRGTLQNLQGMLAELDAANGLRTQPAAWLWTDAATNSTIVRQSPGPSAVSTNLNQDFWKAPGYISIGPPVQYDSLDFVGSVADTSDGNRATRNGSIGIVNTSLAMSLMGSIPANRTAMLALPQQQQYSITWQMGEIQLSGGDRIKGSPDDPPAKVMLQYVPGMHLRLQDVSSPSNPVNRYYYAGPTLAAANVQPPGTGWVEETNAPFHVPLALDAWGNPIIFVPATGVRVYRLMGHDGYSPLMFPEQRWVILSPEGEAINNGSTVATAMAMTTRPGRPFFASAGPDGDFDAGEDNLYSFEK